MPKQGLSACGRTAGARTHARVQLNAAQPSPSCVLVGVLMHACLPPLRGSERPAVAKTLSVHHKAGCAAGRRQSARAKKGQQYPRTRAKADARLHTAACSRRLPHLLARLQRGPSTAAAAPAGHMQPAPGQRCHANNAMQCVSRHDMPARKRARGAHAGKAPPRSVLGLLLPRMRHQCGVLRAGRNRHAACAPPQPPSKQAKLHLSPTLVTHESKS